MTTLPFSNLWSISFFLMLIGLGLSSLYPYYEVGSTFVYGVLKETKKYKQIKKEMISLLVGVSVLVIDIIVFASDAGFYWFKLFDHFNAGLNLIVVLFGQTIILGWYLDLSELEEYVYLNRETIPKVYKISIKYVSPIFLGLLILIGIIDEFIRPPAIPFWALSIGAITGLLPLIFIIVFYLMKYREKDEADIEFTF